MHEWGTRMLLRHYLDQGLTKTELSRRFGVSRRTIHYWIESGQLDRDLATGQTSYAPRPAVASKLDPYKGIIEARLQEFPKLSAQRLFDEISAAGYAGGYSRVRDYVRSTAAGAAGSGRPLRDAGRTTGTSGLRAVRAAVGRSLRAGGGAELLPAAVAALLPDADDGGADRRVGERVRAVRGRSGGTAVRPDARSGAVRRPWERRRADSEHGVPAVRRALGIPCPIVPTVPSAHEGQGGAADPLHPRELFLRPAVRQRRGSQRAGRAVA